ncbi:WXG100 family type VII secretion target [Nocardia sp. NBC_01388]|uniref:WXG100 family type VII secretion target n=1 Tax=Nocardia sp. NBC_01388 TaxID=2903596 RepID=UPI003249FFE1
MAIPAGVSGCEAWLSLLVATRMPYDAALKEGGVAIESGGASGQLNVVPDEVQAFGRLAYKMAEELRSGSSTLDGEVRDLMNTWKGAAAGSYSEGWEEMHRGAVEVWDALFDLAAKLGVTAENYRDTDTNFATAVNSLELP